MLLRDLNEAGVVRFREYLSLLRSGEAIDPPYEILEDSETSCDIQQEIDVEHKEFEVKEDAGKHLADIITQLPEELQWRPGIWTWLSLFYFDQVCPLRGDGSRKVLKDYRYVLSSDFWHRHRHLLANPYIVYTLHTGKGKVMLCGPIHVFSDFNEQIPARQDLLDNPGILDAIDKLYLDTRGNQPKRGALAKDDKPGVLRRLVPVLMQYDLTYDLQGMNSDEILSMLPLEFNTWKS